MQRTKIEYLTHTWSPIAMRCTPISVGCKNCWHLRMAKRLAANPKIATEMRQAYSGESPPMLVQGRVDDPLRLRKPALIGVQWMGDLFHKAIHENVIDLVVSVMRKASQHTFLVLTKRPKRANEWFERYAAGSFSTPKTFPPNVWFGTTVENQETANDRREDFNAFPAAVKFVSYEPALDMVDWKGWEFIDWLIFGGETGHGARPPQPDWFRAARDWAGEHGISRFFKFWGGPQNKGWVMGDQLFSGRLLDGREWNERPYWEWWVASHLPCPDVGFANVKRNDHEYDVYKLVVQDQTGEAVNGVVWDSRPL